ncbi:OmpP1/FadL family transporter [Sandaracinus amylolyticus]|uniref:OmpP1/FadL family transporter n=1 Tax=Sandaracinus amylolyticus TaxID=927083 RepID=UPI001470263C|nr:outer membrane protein transport protein [Sandaracinus amylolyticus]
MPAPRARAGGFEVPDQSAVAGATGGAGTARRDDPSAAFYNPAALADGGGFRGALGILLAVPNISIEHLEGEMETSSTVSGVSPPPHLHLSYAENEWAVGAYLGVSHGTSVSWPSAPDAWWGRFEAMSTNLLVFRAAPFFSLRLGGEHGLLRDFPDIRLSIGAHVDTARAETRRQLDFIDVEGSVHVLMWGAGVGGDASIFWQATPEFALGASYKSRTWMRATGDADFTVPPPFVGRAPDQHASTELVIPDRLTFGAAWQQREFGVFADVGWTAWSVRDRQRVDFERETTSDSDVAQDWRDTWVFRLGGEVTPIDWFHARAGLFYDMEASPPETLGPASPDMARFGVTLGTGFDVTREIGIDASYSYVTFVGRESTSQDAPLARYWGDLHVVSFTARLVVDPTPEPPVVEEVVTDVRPADPTVADEGAPPIDDAPAVEPPAAETPETIAPPPATEATTEAPAAPRRQRAR